MLILTTKISRKKILIGSIIVCGIIAGATALSPNRTKDTISQVGAVAAIENVKNIRTNEDRLNFLNNLGWEVSEDPLSINEVIIPEEFDDTYQKYQQLQEKQGFNLGKYKGKRVKMFAYNVINYPKSKEQVIANILLYKNKIIGGDITSSSVDGFIHELDQFPSPQSTN